MDVIVYDFIAHVGVCVVFMIPGLWGHGGVGRVSNVCRQD